MIRVCTTIILLTIVVVIFFVVQPFTLPAALTQRKAERFKDAGARVAVACLARGYNHISQYNMLLKRNAALFPIVSNLRSSGLIVAFLIFHEGNITMEHQEYLKKQKPELQIRFIDVHETNTKAFSSSNLKYAKPNRTIYETDTSKLFPIGYRHMCHFWFMDFLECLRDYDYVLRVDEDCFVTRFPTDIFESMRERNQVFVTAYYLHLFHDFDETVVTVGLQETIDDFMHQQGLKEEVPLNRIMKFPYTNLFIVDIQYFLKLRLFQEFATQIHKSGGIYINRWGDLPLWGYFLANLLPPSHLFIKDTRIGYFHGSHGKKVN